MQTAPAGHFRAVGTASFGRTMRKPMPFDQRPLEAAAMIDAASAAFEATGEKRWVEEAAHVYAWYLGENDLRLPICTRDDGGCYRSEEHTSELQSLMRISYAVFCLKKKNNKTPQL